MKRLRLSGDERDKYLNDPLIQRWITRLGKGSDKTATMWRSGLGIFLHLTDTSPERLASMEKRTLMDLAETYEATERKRGTMPSTIESRLRMVRHFVQFSGDRVLPAGTFKVKGAEESTDEAALTREQLNAILSSANLRERTCVALMAFSGLRPGAIGDLTGSAGAAIGDVVDMKIEKGKVVFTASPAVVRVPKERSKAGHSYVTMLGVQGQEILREYVESRIRNRERITASSPLIRTDGGRFPRSSEVGDYIRNAFARAKVDARPYSCRTTFISRLSAAEADALVTHEYRLFWSGHRGDMSAKYCVNRGNLNLDEHTLARMRDAYRRCEPLLSTVATRDPVAEIKAAQRVDLLVAFGCSEVEARGILSKSPTDPEFWAIVRAKVTGSEKADIEPATRDGEERPVSPTAVRHYLAAGWKYGGPIPEINEVVVRWAGPVSPATVS